MTDDTLIATRRATTARRRHQRRRTDFYKELGKFAGLIGCVSAAVVGQAEMLSEPYRHWLTVTAIIATATWAYCMKPKSLKAITSFLKRP